MSRFWSHSMRLVEVDKTAVDRARAWLASHDITKYSIDNGVVNVHQNVHIFHDPMAQLPVQFGFVEGLFQLFDCDNLVNLTNGPTKVRGDYLIHGNAGLKNLVGIAKDIKGNINCSHCNSLQSLEGINNTTSCYDIICSYNPSMKSFGPTKITTEVSGGINCSHCTQLTFISNGPSSISGAYDISFCPNITDLLSLFEVTGIVRVITNGSPVGDIMTRGLLASDGFQAQGELFDAGFGHMANF